MRIRRQSTGIPADRGETDRIRFEDPRPSAAGLSGIADQDHHAVPALGDIESVAEFALQHPARANRTAAAYGQSPGITAPHAAAADVSRLCPARYASAAESSPARSLRTG